MTGIMPTAIKTLLFGMVNKRGEREPQNHCTVNRLCLFESARVSGQTGDLYSKMGHISLAECNL